ncbi:MAG: acyltransferase domain-containing protein, partial [Nevskia sp.]
LAGVSSFGFSGTNAHVILEEAPQKTPAPAGKDRPLHLLALSARDGATLQELVRRHEAALATATAPLADLCFTANAGRAHFSHRVAVVGADLDGIRQGLAQAEASQVQGAQRPQVAFLFTGQGAQYAGMGRALYDSAPVFRQALDDCAARLAPLLPRGLLEVIFAAPGEASPINDTLYAQPTTFAIEYALAALWRSWGIEPVAVMGHSLGEYAAAC